ncbi:hypothetical protein [Pararcticibacter amylolyticus]|uniref:Uncharacterized protein n=1 Tax=Pararcticibacter amylolyticus TaxID=2173175 RepID=A0A2U2PD17_9SPHI|nr:hypothetical protein [Pararcticibacter amylolyticus]PWG79288.1 hypothetical protein DDR33_17350 [Pararcticibacter amylolyticus]
MKHNEQRIFDEQLQEDFLSAWPIDMIREIPLHRYVSVNDQTTFCQYVETITRPLGSIKGMNSVKFGIYRRRKPEERPKHVISNKTHSWSQRFHDDSNDEEKVFKKVIEEVYSIASYASEGYFEHICYLNLPSIFRWKVAYLYSGGRLIPIFSIENLRAIVSTLGMPNVDRKTTYWQMQQFLIDRKPLGMTSVEFMRVLYEEFRLGDAEDRELAKRRRVRNGIKSKNLQPVFRKGNAGGMTSPLHNNLQQRLYDQLCLKHGESCVNMERNWIDLLVELKDRLILFEVKPCTFAEDCLKLALGQLMLYAYQAQAIHQDKSIELVIAGPNKLTGEERAMMTFLSERVSFPISYLQID